MDVLLCVVVGHRVIARALINPKNLFFVVIREISIKRKNTSFFISSLQILITLIKHKLKTNQNILLCLSSIGCQFYY